MTLRGRGRSGDHGPARSTGRPRSRALGLLVGATAALLVLTAAGCSADNSTSADAALAAVAQQLDVSERDSPEGRHYRRVRRAGPHRTRRFVLGVGSAADALSTLAGRAKDAGFTTVGDCGPNTCLLQRRTGMFVSVDIAVLAAGATFHSVTSTTAGRG